MNLEEYSKLFPQAYVWPAGSKCLVDGMLQFDEGTACILAGPFPGNYAYFRLRNFALEPEIGDFKLYSVAELTEKHRLANYNFPWRMKLGQPAASEDHLQKRLLNLTKTERIEWDQKQANFVIDVPTQEFPVSLKICGNDDSTWTKFFATEEIAREELNLLLACQPVNFWRDIKENEFVFTN